MMHLELCIRTVSEANRASSEHWRVRHKRAKEQRQAAFAMARAAPDMSAARGWLALGAGLIVHMIRVAPGVLDSDNLASAMKHVRDGLADALGVDDGSKWLAWTYDQRRGPRGGYLVEVHIVPVVLG